MLPKISITYSLKVTSPFFLMLPVEKCTSNYRQYSQSYCTLTIYSCSNHWYLSIKTVYYHWHFKVSFVQITAKLIFIEQLFQCLLSNYSHYIYKNFVNDMLPSLQQTWQSYVTKWISSDIFKSSHCPIISFILI